MSTYLELKEQAEELMRKAEEIRKKEVVEVIADIKDKIIKYKITAADLGFTEAAGSGKEGDKNRSQLPPKFKGPNGEYWSGRGRMPNWVKEIKENGGNLEDYAI